ncbi:hypothetical protein M0R45_025560 [Rubus argutus]|uniref:Uncharacterized protein n=1 Tax=Rubus argutus TaxID=59490 RepID=A0AAW1WXB2_RUBAR
MVIVIETVRWLRVLVVSVLIGYGLRGAQWLIEWVVVFFTAVRKGTGSDGCMFGVDCRLRMKGLVTGPALEFHLEI